MIVEECKDIEELRPLGELWVKELNAAEYGLKVDLNTILNELESWMQGAGVVLIGRDGDEIIGGIAVFVVPSYLGDQKFAVEKYWYTKKGCITAGPKLYVKAVEWAEKNGCSHMVTSGSKLASGRHDSICRFLEKTGAKHFETSYIYEL